MYFLWMFKKEVYLKPELSMFCKPSQSDQQFYKTKCKHSEANYLKTQRWHSDYSDYFIRPSVFLVIDNKKTYLKLMFSPIIQEPLGLLLI